MLFPPQNFPQSSVALHGTLGHAAAVSFQQEQQPFLKQAAAGQRYFLARNKLIHRMKPVSVHIHWRMKQDKIAVVSQQRIHDFLICTAVFPLGLQKSAVMKIDLQLREVIDPVAVNQSRGILCSLQIGVIGLAVKADRLYPAIQSQIEVKIFGQVNFFIKANICCCFPTKKLSRTDAVNAGIRCT